MSFSPVLRWLVLILLVLTLGWKVALRHHDSELEKREPEGERKIAEFLVRQHFTPVSEKPTGQLPVIRAVAGPCRMLVIKSSYDGSDRDRIMRGYVSATDTVFVVFGGRIYTEQPTLLTVSDFLWARFQRQLGLRAEATPVLFVIANKGCEAERLPWSDLG